MILITHVSIAVASVIYAAFVLVAPSIHRLYINYVLIGLTVISGSALVIVEHVRVLEVCTTGLIYVAIMLTASVFIKRRLAQKIRN